MRLMRFSNKILSIILVDLLLVTNITTGPSPLNTKNLSSNTITTNNISSQDLSFSLMSGPDTVLAEFIATAYIQYSEWTDGFNMLFDKNIGSKDTAEFIHAYINRNWS